MDYKGRIVITSLLLLMIVSARIYGNFYYNVPIIQAPVLGVPFLLIFWWLGWFYDKVKYLAEKDFLTELYNRSYIVKVFPKILAYVKRKKENISLFFIDVNDFKSINDTYGHEIGDSVLQIVSRVILRNIGKKEIAARWSGDEFLILSPSLSANDTKLKLERIQQDLKESSSKINIGLSISVGVSVYPGDGESLEKLLKIADENMYKEKFALLQRDRSAVSLR